MRLARPVYESLPAVYMVIGAAAISTFYIDPLDIGGKIAFVIGILAEIAAVTIVLRRQDYRALSRKYSGEAVDLKNLS